MMQPMKYLMLLSLILFVSACGTKEKVITQTEFIEKSVPIQQHPDPVNMLDVDFFVVTEDNLDAFIKEFKSNNYELVFIALTVKDYENLSLNIADLRRYIQQQKLIIVYYEKAVGS